MTLLGGADTRPPLAYHEEINGGESAGQPTNEARAETKLAFGYAHYFPLVSGSKDKLVGFADLCHDSAIQASLMALAVPSVPELCSPTSSLCEEEEDEVNICRITAIVLIVIQPETHGILSHHKDTTTISSKLVIFLNVMAYTCLLT